MDINTVLNNQENMYYGHGTGPFEWKDNVVTNYDEVMSKMTDSYKKSFEGTDNGFSIPVNENGIWKNYGEYRTDKESKFKDIKVTLVDSCKIHYEITYTYTNIGDTNKVETKIKTNLL